VPRVSSFELPISASHIHLLRVLPLVGCRSKTPTCAKCRSVLHCTATHLPSGVAGLQAVPDRLQVPLPSTTRMLLRSNVVSTLIPGTPSQDQPPTPHVHVRHHQRFLFSRDRAAQTYAFVRTRAPVHACTLTCTRCTGKQWSAFAHPHPHLVGVPFAAL
jgi:hypothetical protein